MSDPITLTPRPTPAGSWWIGLTREQFSDRLRAEAARMDGTLAASALHGPTRLYTELELRPPTIPQRSRL